jgi:intermediate filament protein if
LNINFINLRYQRIDENLDGEKSKIKVYQDQIASNEAEIGLLRRRLEDLQDEEKRFKQESQRMLGEIQRVSNELENEMKHRLSLENDKQSLEEELLFIKEIHAKEIEELKHLSMVDAGLDPAVFFKSELATSIREIREEYEKLNQTQKNEMEGWYRLKVKLLFFFYFGKN